MRASFDLPLADTPSPEIERRDSQFRLLTLACVYGAALAFAVICSPAVGLVTLGHPQPAPQQHVARLASGPGY